MENNYEGLVHALLKAKRAGMTQANTAVMLNSQGYKTPFGKAFTQDSVNLIHSNLHNRGTKQNAYVNRLVEKMTIEGKLTTDDVKVMTSKRWWKANDQAHTNIN